MTRNLVRVARAVMLLAISAVPAVAQADSTSERAIATTWVPARTSTLAPLRHTLALDLENVSVKQALQVIGARGGIQIAYGDDVLRSDVHVTLRGADLTVREALVAALEGTGLEAYVSLTGRTVLVRRAIAGAGSVVGHVTDARTGRAVVGARVALGGTRLTVVTNDSGGFRITDVPAGSYALTVRRIGYVPATRAVTVGADREVTVDVRLEVSASPLDAVVVTGTISPAEQKSLSSPISLVTAKDIEDKGITKINDLFRGDLPGVFAADYGESSAAFGAPVYVRGTSQLEDFPTLKTYIDGVEIANSQFLNEIDPSMIDHIEIIRGPQASTLYGAQAMSGVMQVFTKKGTLAVPPHVMATVGIGGLEGPYGTSLRQQHNLSLTGGTHDLSYNVGATYQHDGAWTRDHVLDVYSGYGSLSIRPAGSPLQVDVTARVGLQRSRTGGQMTVARAIADGTLQLDPAAAIVRPDLASLPQQTLGISLGYTPRSGWQHSLTLGFDRGADGLDQVWYPAFIAPSDTLINLFSTQTSRTTVSYHSARDWSLGQAITANVTAGADYWSYSRNEFYDAATTTDVGSLGTTDFILLLRDRDHDAGVFSQVRLGVAEALFVTAGLRVDQGPALPEDRHHRSFNPRIGASYTFGAGSVRAKLRAGWGSALRPADPARKQFVEYNPSFIQLAAPNLLPERQQGWDAGVELYAGDRASLSITRYRQTARDLIWFRFLTYAPIAQGQYLNLARVRNTGWELEGSLRLFAGLAAKATYSQVESVIEALAPDDQTGYTVGDQLPGVPHHTGALTLTERTSRLSAEASISYVGSSINYNAGASYYDSHVRLGAPTYFFGNVPLPAAYRLGVRVAYDLTPRLALFAHGENLTNRRVLDQGSFSLDLLGRTTLVGLRVR